MSNPFLVSQSLFLINFLLSKQGSVSQYIVYINKQNLRFIQGSGGESETNIEID